MRRNKQQLTQEECRRILKSEVRGVLSMIGDQGYPYGVPINFWYDEVNNKIYFHGGREGHRIDAIKGCDKVSFCTYDKGTRSDSRLGLDYRSVIVFGRIKIVTDQELTIRVCRKLGEQFPFGSDYIENEIKNFAQYVMVLELLPEHMTGKLVNES